MLYVILLYIKIVYKLKLGIILIPIKSLFSAARKATKNKKILFLVAFLSPKVVLFSTVREKPLKIRKKTYFQESNILPKIMAPQKLTLFSAAKKSCQLIFNENPTAGKLL
jgi:hypothetical protein